MSDSTPSEIRLPRDPYVDTNLFCGPYPFRRLPDTDGDGLLRLLDETHAWGALVTPFRSVFYADALSGLEETLERAPRHPWLRFAAVVNPAFPGWREDLEIALRYPRVSAVRVFPRRHHYGAADECLAELAEVMAGRPEPLVISARLSDDRLNPEMLNVDPPLDLAEVAMLLKERPDTRFILTQFYINELPALRSAVIAHGETYVDIGCCKPREFWWEEAVREWPVDRLLFGTGAPLYYHGGSRLSFSRAELEPEVREAILLGNAGRLLGLPWGEE